MATLEEIQKLEDVEWPTNMPLNLLSVPETPNFGQTQRTFTRKIIHG